MTLLQLTTTQKLSRARSDLRMGAPVVINDDKNYLLFAVETLNATQLDEIQNQYTDVRLIISERRASTLKIPCYDGPFAQISIKGGVEFDWVRCVADPSKDLSRGPLGPFQILRNTATGLENQVLTLLKSAELLPAAIMVAQDSTDKQIELHSITLLHSTELLQLTTKPIRFEETIAARLPLKTSHNGRLHVFKSNSGGQDHYAMVIGRPKRQQPVTVRLHSACFTGDVLGSLKCDCGAQLDAALKYMAEVKSGILLYLNQEGRGIGLANKMRAYSLQDKGFDTVEANHRLGFEDDERDFRIGAEILKKLGFHKIRLMTNNPNKIQMLQKQGLVVTERVPLQIHPNPENTSYLTTKARKSGHLLK